MGLNLSRAVLAAMAGGRDRHRSGARESRGFSHSRCQESDHTIDKLDVEDRAAVKALAAKSRGTRNRRADQQRCLLGEMKAQAVASLDYADAPSS
jgi:hypothetical protein